MFVNASCSDSFVSSRAFVVVLLPISTELTSFISTSCKGVMSPRKGFRLT